MNFLQDLVNELSNESKNNSKELDELLDYTIESALNDIVKTLSMSKTLEDNFHNHFSSGDESFENYQSYERSTQLILNSSGIDLPVEILVPSFESLTFTRYSTEADVKKDNVLKRAWDWLVTKFRQMKTWLTGKFKKDAETLANVTSKLPIRQKAINSLAKDNPPFNIDISVSESWLDGGKLNFTKFLGMLDKTTDIIIVKSDLKIIDKDEFASRMTDIQNIINSEDIKLKPLKMANLTSTDCAKAVSALNASNINSIYNALNKRLDVQNKELDRLTKTPTPTPEDKLKFEQLIKNTNLIIKSTRIVINHYILLMHTIGKVETTMAAKVGKVEKNKTTTSNSHKAATNHVNQQNQQRQNQQIHQQIHNDFINQQNQHIHNQVHHNSFM